MRKSVVGKYNLMYRNKKRRVSFLPSVQEVFGVEGNISAALSPDSSTCASSTGISEDEELGLEETPHPPVEISIGSGFEDEERKITSQRRYSEGAYRPQQQQQQQETKIARRPSRRNSRVGMLSMKQMTELAKNTKNQDEALGLDAHFRRASSIESSISNSSFHSHQSLGTNLRGSTLPRVSPFIDAADISGGSSTGDAAQENAALHATLREVLGRLKRIEKRIGGVSNTPPGSAASTT